MKNTTAIMAITPIRANPPHNGAVTHHQDQVMYPINLRVIKIRNIRLNNPIPFDEFELFFDIITF
jgi:hypothetical protein